MLSRYTCRQRQREPSGTNHWFSCSGVHLPHFATKSTSKDLQLEGVFLHVPVKVLEILVVDDLLVVNRHLIDPHIINYSTELAANAHNSHPTPWPAQWRESSCQLQSFLPSVQMSVIDWLTTCPITRDGDEELLPQCRFLWEQL